jgi:hypothetical protein
MNYELFLRRFEKMRDEEIEDKTKKPRYNFLILGSFIY